LSSFDLDLLNGLRCDAHDQHVLHYLCFLYRDSLALCSSGEGIYSRHRHLESLLRLTFELSYVHLDSPAFNFIRISISRRFPDPRLSTLLLLLGRRPSTIELNRNNGASSTRQCCSACCQKNSRKTPTTANHFPNSCFNNTTTVQRDASTFAERWWYRALRRHYQRSRRIQLLRSHAGQLYYSFLQIEQHERAISRCVR